MAPAYQQSDADLIAEMCAGDRAAVEAFVCRYHSMLEAICGSVTSNTYAQAEALGDLIAFDGFANLFSGFDGKSPLKNYALTAIVEGFLFPRLMRRISFSPAVHAAEFESFFHLAIVKAIRRLVLDEDLEKDAFQWICEQLLRNDYEQLRVFSNQAKTQGYIVVKLRFLAKDFLNSRDAPTNRHRRTLPECLKDSTQFDQDVYRQVFWWQAANARLALLALQQHYSNATEREVIEARTRVEAQLAAHGGIINVDARTVSLDEGEVADRVPYEPDSASDIEEIERSAFRNALLTAAKDLSPREKLYLLRLLQGHAAGAISELMRLPVGEVYTLGRRVLNKLRRELSPHPAARALIASMTGKDALEGNGPNNLKLTDDRGSRAKKG